MKVAFPTNNGEKIARHASLCKSFLIVDAETGERVTVSNPLKEEGIVPHQGHHGEGEKRHRGTGRIVPELLAAQGVEQYVCLEAGEGLQSRLQRRGIGVSVVTEKLIDAALKQTGTLQPARWSIHAPVGRGRHGEHRHDGTHCEARGRGERLHLGRSSRHGGNGSCGDGRRRRAHCRH